MIKASHIFSSPGGRAASEKEKLREKLLAIKRDIADKKSTFAAAANKSRKTRPTPRDLAVTSGIRPPDWLVENFANAAFALKPGEVSDPVETMHGWHLIMVTDRKEGARSTSRPGSATY